ncbi:hypothetical protein E1H18_4606 [Caulobacter sp. RHG1]|nr:hypothetical protein [Caulobacter sp. RHG1]
MAWTATWLKTISGALCGLVLVVFTLVPAVDSLLCGFEGRPAVSAQLAVGKVVATSDHDDRSQTGKVGGEVCAHGHCHHGLSAAPPIGAMAAVALVRPLVLAPETSGLPPSNQPDGPTEPPRV